MNTDDALYPVLFGTRLRGITNLGATGATLGGTGLPVLYIGIQSAQFVGLDQVNLGPLPRSLAGRGPIVLRFTFGAQEANAVQLSIR